MATLGNLAVGSSVYFKVDNTLTEFIVIHQGNPSTTYYGTDCDNTWLLMRDLWKVRNWDSSDNDYANSDVHTELNSTFYNAIDANIRNAIINVKIPYTSSTGTVGTLQKLNNGLSTNIFLLSRTEAYYSNTVSATNTEGATLSFFQSATNADKIAYYNGTAYDWWLRSPDTTSTLHAYRVSSSGASGAGSANVISYEKGVRPALILNSMAQVDGSGNVDASGLFVGYVTSFGENSGVTVEDYTNSTNPANPITQTVIGTPSSTSNANGTSITATAKYNPSGYAYFLFDTSSIPANATIVSVSCTARISVTQYGTYTMQMTSGTTEKGSAYTLSTASTSARVCTLDCGDWTRDELNDARIKISMSQSGLALNTIKANFTGCTLTVVYEVPASINMSATIEGASKDISSGYANIGGVWKELVKVYTNIGGVWKE